jgi:hypothetical protein
MLVRCPNCKGWYELDAAWVDRAPDSPSADAIDCEWCHRSIRRDHLMDYQHRHRAKTPNAPKRGTM